MYGIIAKFYRTDLVIYSHSREGKTLPYRGINTVAVYFIRFLTVLQIP